MLKTCGIGASGIYFRAYLALVSKVYETESSSNKIQGTLRQCLETLDSNFTVCAGDVLLSGGNVFVMY